MLITIASILAAFVVLVVVGAYLPAVPKIGILGPVVAGQWPLHLSMIIGGGLLLTTAAWKFGPHRTGRILTLAMGVASLGVASIIVQQVIYAHEHGAEISWHDVFTQMAYPATTPDNTSTYATLDGDALKVDIYLPADRIGHPTPAIVLAHSGGFHAVDFTKADLRGTARWLADHGIATFAIDYRLATATSPTWDKAPQDLVCALAWVNEHAAGYNIDPSAVSLGGMSAGGTLALNAAYRLQENTISSSCGTDTTPTGISRCVRIPGWTSMRCGNPTGSGHEMRPRCSPADHPTPCPTDIAKRHPRPTPDPGSCQPCSSSATETTAQPRTAWRTSPTDSDRDSNPVSIAVLPFADHTFDDAYGSITSQTSRYILNDFLHDAK